MLILHLLLADSQITIHNELHISATRWLIINPLSGFDSQVLILFFGVTWLKIYIPRSTIFFQVRFRRPYFSSFSAWTVIIYLLIFRMSVANVVSLKAEVIPPTKQGLSLAGLITTVDNFNYAGRPVQLDGPPKIFTIQFTDRRGGFCWFDPVTLNVWHRVQNSVGSLRYACSFYSICKRAGHCSGTPDGAIPHNHSSNDILLYHLRQIRLEFSIRNYFALSREAPSLDQFCIVYHFYHNRFHGTHLPAIKWRRVPRWIIHSARSGFPYSCEANRVGSSLSGIMLNPIRHVVALVEANAVFEYERFRLLDSYLKYALPPDYGSPEMMKSLVPSWTYVRRWDIPGNCLLLISSS